MYTLLRITTSRNTDFVFERDFERNVLESVRFDRYVQSETLRTLYLDQGVEVETDATASKRIDNKELWFVTLREIFLVFQPFRYDYFCRKTLILDEICIKTYCDSIFKLISYRVFLRAFYFFIFTLFFFNYMFGLKWKTSIWSSELF